MVTVQVTDYSGNTVLSSTGMILANPQLRASVILNRTSYNVTQGQNVTISDVMPTNGTLPYHYQWLTANYIGGPFSSSVANSLCAVNPNTLNCVFAPTASTHPGLYEFELEISDSAYAPTTFVTKPIIVRVVALPGASTTTANATTTTAATTVSSTTFRTTSSATTTMPTTSVPSTPATPVVQATQAASSLWTTAVNWLDTALRYIV
jgi:hypothetical protein